MRINVCIIVFNMLQAIYRQKTSSCQRCNKAEFPIQRLDTEFRNTPWREQMMNEHLFSTSHWNSDVTWFVHKVTFWLNLRPQFFLPQPQPRSVDLRRQTQTLLSVWAPHHVNDNDDRHITPHYQQRRWRGRPAPCHTAPTMTTTATGFVCHNVVDSSSGWGNMRWWRQYLISSFTYSLT